MEKRRVHPRTKVDPRQQQILEEIFQKTHYPSASFKTKISSQLSLPLKYLDIWFQNRRAKEKRLGDPKLKSEAQIFNSVFKGSSSTPDTNFSNINLNFELLLNSKTTTDTTGEDFLVEDPLDKLWTPREVSQQEAPVAASLKTNSVTENNSTAKLSISSLLNDEPSEDEAEQSTTQVPSPPQASFSVQPRHPSPVPPALPSLLPPTSRPAPPNQEDLLAQLSSIARSHRTAPIKREVTEVANESAPTFPSPLLLSRLSAYFGKIVETKSDNNNNNSKLFPFSPSASVSQYRTNSSQPPIIPPHVLSSLMHSSDMRPTRNSVNNLYFL